ncbi:L,D-transpeptidase family protein [Halomonas halocynthiae]|uniref:L,D-transpeptidase family protein n=1 Tax=Halomonas halocynthiae TaxID=176290 RepID=UPI0009FBBA89|nr:L,D-transpeptidase family protein [Halomonas halocynthiae]
MLKALSLLTHRSALTLVIATGLALSMPAIGETSARKAFPLPENVDVVGELYAVTAKEDDTLIDIGHQHGIGYEAMVRANPDVSVWYPGKGTEVMIPGQFILPDAPREGVVVNVAEMRLYYYPPGKDEVETYPIAVGRMDWKTPLGKTTITEKVENPTWIPPQSIRKEHAEAGNPLPAVVPAGPDNPMGNHKMRLGIPGYLIHGTNKPDGVGMRVTHGCIRMLPEDIENLFPRLPLGTSVRLVNESFKLGWNDEHLYVQAYPYLDEETEKTMQRVTEALAAVDAATKDLDYPVDYAKLRKVVEVPSGMPVALGDVPSQPEAPATMYQNVNHEAAATFIDRLSIDG